MKKKTSLVLLSVCTFLLLSDCAAFSRREYAPIEWPSDIRHMQAVAQVNIEWSTTRYSGDMSLKLDYPDSLLLEVYGPFGDTILSIRKTVDSFLLRVGSEVYRDKTEFEKQFYMTVEEFMEDLTMKGDVQSDTQGNLFTQRDQYRVVYSLNGGQNRVCWLSPEGTMCIRFLEADFQ